ncbi:MAG: bifunctional metallophosphatase/5'-nucleotidase [Akkermansiaceae bacterium]
MNPTRRHALKAMTGTAASIIGMPLTPLMAAMQQSSVKTISIIHTTDLHGHILPSTDYDGNTKLGGLAKCATQIRSWRNMNPSNILVDIGDLYQGTPVSQLCNGKVMVELINKIGYDSWTLGNHEFDWGLQAVEEAANLSKMPILTANIEYQGRKPGKWGNADHPLAKRVAPFMLKEVDGFKIGIVGLVTPGLPYWLSPDLLKGVKPLDPVECLQNSVTQLQAMKADAIIVTGHMGFKFRYDYANPLDKILGKVQGIDLYIGGHSHMDMSYFKVNGVLCTQAAYHGIQCGRVDLTFDRETRKLLKKRIVSNLMDDRFAEDPIVLQHAQPYLDTATKYTEKEVGELLVDIEAKGPNKNTLPLFANAFNHLAAKQKLKVDAIFHGTFGGTLKAGKVTMGDLWTLIPYDNMLALCELSVEEMLAVINEADKSRMSDRELLGLTAIEKDKKFVAIKKGDKALPPNHRITVLFNSYDLQSGGQKLMTLRKIGQATASNKTMLDTSTRDALAEYFLDKKVVSVSDL